MIVMAVKRVRVYEEDWKFVEENFSGGNNPERFRSLVRNVKKLLELVEMYKEVAEMYREENKRLNALAIRQSMEIEELKEMLKCCNSEGKEEKKPWYRRLFGHGGKGL